MTDADEAKSILHEDQISTNVASVREQLSGKQWTLYYARDYLLGVLQLLEHAHLLRNMEQEAAAERRREEMLRTFGPKTTPREKAYKRLAQLAADILPPSYGEEVKRIANVRTDDEPKAAQR